jgi:hypothetical protein
MTLYDLADKVERLTGPCRETDAEICLAIKRPQGIVRAPAYTASLDAAMTLARNNREAMVMMYVAHRTFEHAEMDDPPNLLPRIKAMLAWHGGGSFQRCDVSPSVTGNTLADARRKWDQRA